jgi:hypothetical protein
MRKITKNFKALALMDLHWFVGSPIHEDRLFTMLVLVNPYQKAAGDGQTAIADFYLAHTRRIYNWGILAAPAHKILGHNLLERPRKILDSVVRSPVLREHRSAIFVTNTFITAGIWPQPRSWAKAAQGRPGLDPQGHELDATRVWWARSR